MAGNENSGRKAIWETPQALLADFNRFVKKQEPRKIKVLGNVQTLKKGREHIKNPKKFDFEWKIKRVERISEPGIVTISQFAAWKGVHRTTITTGYSAGAFQDVYERILATCEAFTEKRLYSADRNAANIIFAQKAYADKRDNFWRDKTELELSGELDTPLSDEAKAILAKATRADDDKGFDDGTSET